MAIVMNAKGTTSPYFKIGKQGTNVFQGSSDPASSYTTAEGDMWIDTSNKITKFRNSGNDGWTQGSLDITGNATISGDLTINGTTTTLDTTNLLIEDPLLVLARNVSGTPTYDAGIVVERGDSTNVGIIWDESADQFAVVNTTETGSTAGNVSIASYANIKADEFHGDGSNLTSVNATTFTATANDSTNEGVYLVFVDGQTGAQGAETDTGLIYNPSTGIIQSTGYTADGGTVIVAEGSAGSPSVALVSNTNTGMYKVGTNRIGFTTGGSHAMGVGSGTNGGDVDIANNLVVTGTVTSTLLDVNSSGASTIDSSGGPALQVTQSTAGENALRVIGSHASFTGNVLQPWSARAAGTAFDFIECVASNGSEVPFRVRGDGQLTSSAGASFSGNVGIGTSSPSHELDVTGSARLLSSSPQLLLQDSDGTNQFTQIIQSGGRIYLDLRNDSSNGELIVRGKANGSATEFVRIDSSGNVGIGTTSPAATLDVTGTDAVIVAKGTTAERPGTPESGMIRFNTTTSCFEGYNGSSWVNLGAYN